MTESNNQTKNYISQIDTQEKEIARDKIVSSMTIGMEKYLIEQEYIKIYPSLLTSITGACEQINTMFTLDFFGKLGFLTQSSQLRLEKASFYHEKVYCIINSFRAEPSIDTRHLCEFNLTELEQRGDLSNLMVSVENTIKSGVDYVLNKNEKELHILGRNTKELENFKIDRISYEDAIKLLNYSGYPELQFGMDLKHEHEMRLTQLLGAVFCTEYPEEIKFWNMKGSCKDPRVVMSADLLLPKSGESGGMACRETKRDILEQKLIKSDMYKLLTEIHGLGMEDFQWYLDFHDTNTILEHSGVGLGNQRICQWLMNFDAIQDTTMYPTYRGNLW